MLSNRGSIPTLYNPGNQTKEEIINNFVARNQEFNDVLVKIKGSDGVASTKHILIMGQRGYGKTTLLLRLFYEIQRDENLSKEYIPVIFDEEQYNIRTLYKLWENIAISLEEQYDTMFYGLLDKISDIKNKENDEQVSYEILNERLISNNKKLVLFIDNLGDLIKKFELKEVITLISILSEAKNIKFVGASSDILETNTDLMEILDNFDVVHLSGLSENEATILLKKLGENYKSDKIAEIINSQPERIETLRRLTGGVPRTIVLLFEVFVDYENGDPLKDLEIILDRVTPLYKHRMDDLSPQQQEIIDAMAISWDAVSIKEISKYTTLDKKIIENNLRLLEKSKFVYSIITDSNTKFYQITERFFNIWYLMRYGRKKDRNKVLWIVKFLTNWCNEEDIINTARKHLKELQEGILDAKDAIYMTEVLSSISITSELQDEMIKGTKKLLERINSELIADLPETDEEIIKVVYNYLEQRKYRLALTKLQEVKNPDGFIFGLLAFIYETGLGDVENALKNYIKAVEKGNVKALNNLALLYQNELKDYENAEKYFITAIENGNTKSILNLGLLYYGKIKNYEKAKEYLDKAIEQGMFKAYIQLGLIEQEVNKNFEKAAEYYNLALEKGVDAGYYYLAQLYQNSYHDYKTAEDYYLKSVEKGNNNAVFNLALLYQNKLHDYEKAKKYYLISVNYGNVDAMNNLAVIFKKDFKDYKKAEEYYLKALKKGNKVAANNLALLYQNELNNISKAIEYYEIAVREGNIAAVYNLGILYRDSKKDFENSDKYFKIAAEKGHNKGMIQLAYNYFEQKKEKDTALDLAKNAFDFLKDQTNAYIYTLILIWHNKFEENVSIAEKYVETEEFMSDINRRFEKYIMFLIANKKTEYVYNMFDENKFDCKYRFRPLYYALMFFMKDTHPDEYQRMGDELKQTVVEIVIKIKQMRVQYNIN